MSLPPKSFSRPPRHHCCRLGWPQGSSRLLDRNAYHLHVNHRNPPKEVVVCYFSKKERLVKMCSRRDKDVGIVWIFLTLNIFSPKKWRIELVIPSLEVGRKGYRRVETRLVILFRTIRVHFVSKTQAIKFRSESMKAVRKDISRIIVYWRTCYAALTLETY